MHTMDINHSLFNSILPRILLQVCFIFNELFYIEICLKNMQTANKPAKQTVNKKVFFLALISNNQKVECRMCLELSSFWNKSL